MIKLDAWTEQEILQPLQQGYLAYSQAQEGEAAVAAKLHTREVEAQIKKLVRGKVLESFRNGQKVKSSGFQKGGRYGR